MKTTSRLVIVIAVLALLAVAAATIVWGDSPALLADSIIWGN